MERELLGRNGWPIHPAYVAGLELIGRQLRRARREKGWTQMQLERASGVDQTTISRLENGRLTSISILKLGAIALALAGLWRFDVG
jgi:transcriptional regulator with XRE-family HTH domain